MGLLTVKETKEIIWDFLDRWAVEERPRSLLGATFGIFFFISVVIYSIYLGIILTTAAPVQTSLLESTGKHVYNITIKCVDIWAIPRDETPDYNYGYEDTGGDDYSYVNTGSSDSPCKNSLGCYLDYETNFNCALIDDPTADCVSRGACVVCLDKYPAGTTCDNMTWVEGASSSKKRDTGGYAAPTDTCKISYRYAKGSPCYTKKDAGEVIRFDLELNDTLHFNICSPKPGRDFFNIFVSETTKIFIVGTDSDYEIYGYSGETGSILLNRLRTDDRTVKKKSDVWYGIPINVVESESSVISLQLAPIFDVIIMAPAFSWLGWAGQVGGIAGAFGSAWGVGFAITSWVLLKLRPKNKVHNSSTSEEIEVETYSK